MIENKSNINIVKKNAKKYKYDPTKIYYSYKPDKKYMILNPHTNKFIHFGHSSYEDYTYHKDEKRRLNFKKRNHLWKDKPKYSPARLAYDLLW